MNNLLPRIAVGVALRSSWEREDVERALGSVRTVTKGSRKSCSPFPFF